MGSRRYGIFLAGSSHGSGLHRPGDQKNVATMLLLCPGGAQIYYGDETARPAINGCGDTGMATRGDFNWDAVDNVVTPWQFVSTPAKGRLTPST